MQTPEGLCRQLSRDRQQLVWIEGLHQPAGSPELLGLQDGSWLAFSGQHDDPEVRVGGAATNSGEHLKTGHTWHVDVAYDQVEVRPLLDHIGGLHPVTGFNRFKPIQRPSDLVPYDWRVIHNQDFLQGSFSNGRRSVCPLPGVGRRRSERFAEEAVRY